MSDDISKAMDQLAADLAAASSVSLSTARATLHNAMIGMLPDDYIVSDVLAHDGSRKLTFADGTTWTVPASEETP